MFYFVFVLLMFSCVHIGTDCLSGTCIDCEKGFYCPTENITSPFPCPLGQYSNVKGSVNCTTCPAGFYCNRTDTSPVKCSLGYYSTSGMSICIPCQAGYR